MSYEINGRSGHDLGVYIVIPAVPGLNPYVNDQSYLAASSETTLRFLDQPVLSETRTANYEPESLLHSTEAFQAYSTTDQREFTIEGRFFSRNNEDARRNNKIINVVRSLVLPDYNNSGAPPTPVKLYAYGSRHISGVPCVVRNYTFDFVNDVDYITLSDEGISIPVVFNITMTLGEQHSVKALRQFNLTQFRSGEMIRNGF